MNSSFDVYKKIGTNSILSGEKKKKNSKKEAPKIVYIRRSKIGEANHFSARGQKKRGWSSKQNDQSPREPIMKEGGREG